MTQLLLEPLMEALGEILEAGGILTHMLLECMMEALGEILEAGMIMTQLLLEPLMVAQEMMEQPGAKLEAVGEKPTVLPVLWEDMLEVSLILTSVDHGQLLEITLMSTLALTLKSTLEITLILMTWAPPSKISTQPTEMDHGAI